MPTKSDGAKIRRLREGMGLTATQLARQVGISVGFMSKIENSALSGSPKTRLAIADALGVPLDDITFQAPRRALKATI